MAATMRSIAGAETPATGERHASDEEPISHQVPFVSDDVLQAYPLHAYGTSFVMYRSANVLAKATMTRS